MIIDYLGHSEFLVKIRNKNNEEVRILCDTWLSSYVVGDMLGRNPIITIDYASLGYIDAVYISHGHTDHLDPYTLIELYSKLAQKPILVLPETLAFLKPLFEEYLTPEKIVVLRHKDVVDIKGIKLRGYIFENLHTTNEDDVMSLFISNDTEIVFTEVDSIPPETSETWEYMYRIFTEKKYETVLYLATRNELEGNLKLLDIQDIHERKKFAQEYENTRKEEIEYEYVKFAEEYVEYKDVTNIKGFCRIYIGQGICYPIELDAHILKVRLMPLEENVKWDMYFSRQYGKKFFIGYFEAGKSYVLEAAKISSMNSIPYLSNLRFENPKIDVTYSFTRKYFSTPVFDEARDRVFQEDLIVQLLNTRFLPYQFGNTQINLKNMMLKNGKYTLKIKFGTSKDVQEVFYTCDFSKVVFEKVESKNGYYDESYWANDIEDFYNGVQELYSNFHHTLESGKTYLFWTCLGANFINNDIIYRKFQYHFQQASMGKTADQFVKPIYEKLLGIKV